MVICLQIPTPFEAGERTSLGWSMCIMSAMLAKYRYNLCPQSSETESVEVAFGASSRGTAQHLRVWTLSGERLCIQRTGSRCLDQVPLSLKLLL
jgi:hypothetical protein